MACSLCDNEEVVGQAPGLAVKGAHFPYPGSFKSDTIVTENGHPYGREHLSELAFPNAPLSDARLTPATEALEAFNPEGLNPTCCP